MPSTHLSACAMSEFQAVIMAINSESDLYPLCIETPLSLLPVAHQPLIQYQLDLMEKAGIPEVILLTTAGSLDKISEYLDNTYKGQVHVEKVVVEEHMPTAQALLLVKDRIRSDFIVMTSDFIWTSPTAFHQLADIHRQRSATLTALMRKKPAASERRRKKGGVTSSSTADIVGIGEEGRLVYLKGIDEIEDGDKDILIRKSMLRKFPNVTLHNGLDDVHFYIFSKWVLEYLEERKAKIRSISHHLVPQLVRMQVRQSTFGPTSEDDLFSFAASLSTTRDYVSHLAGDAARCYAHVAECSAAVTCARITSTDAYLNVNYEVGMASRKDHPATRNPLEKQKNVGDAMVGEGTTLGPRSTLKKAVVGRNCKIGNNVKIIASLLLDDVIVEDGSTIKGSIVSNNARVGPKSVVDSSVVSVAYECKAGKTYSSVLLADGHDDMDE